VNVDTNPLYDYSAIVRRPKLELPEGKKLAVYCGISLEHYLWGKPAISVAQFTAELVPDPLNFGWREYGPRVGVFRLMELFDRYEFPVTALLNSDVCDEHPAIIEEGSKRGWSWVGHGANNSSWIVGMDHDTELGVIGGITDKIESATGTRPRGWLGPALTESPHTNGVLSELGYTYTLNWGIDDEPVGLKVPGGKPFLAVPYSTELNDLPAFSLQGQGAPEFADAVIDQFDQMLEEGAERPRVMGFGLHPFLTGQPYRARRFAKVLEHIAAHRDEIWLTTADEIAAHHLASQK
jgi:peptidoglycan/xylan/chitin deacetylase (PgdA/CDA1 family)